MKKKNSKGLGLTRKTKMVSTIIMTLVIVSLMSASYMLGNVRGHVQGAYNMVGTKGICDQTGGVMEGEYCVLDAIGLYKHHIECSWGKFIVNDDEEISWYTNLDPRTIVMKCNVEN